MRRFGPLATLTAGLCAASCALVHATSEASSISCGSSGPYSYLGHEVLTTSDASTLGSAYHFREVRTITGTQTGTHRGRSDWMKPR